MEKQNILPDSYRSCTGPVQKDKEIIELFSLLLEWHIDDKKMEEYFEALKKQEEKYHE